MQDSPLNPATVWEDVWDMCICFMQRFKSASLACLKGRVTRHVALSDDSCHPLSFPPAPQDSPLNPTTVWEDVWDLLQYFRRRLSGPYSSVKRLEKHLLMLGAVDMRKEEVSSAGSALEARDDSAQCCCTPCCCQESHLHCDLLMLGATDMRKEELSFAHAI